MATPSQDKMWCTVCKTEKPFEEMNKQSQQGFEKRCKSCQRKYEAERRDRKREEINQYHREWRQKLGRNYNEYMVNRRKKKISGMSEAELAEFRKFESDKSKRLAAKLKDEVFNAYGGWVCACCGEKEKSFLTMDHMQNNGSQLRKEGVHGHSTQFYRWLKKSGYPEDFQVLCMNCQFGKRMNNGICPHSVRCND